MEHQKLQIHRRRIRTQHIIKDNTVVVVDYGDENIDSGDETEYFESNDDYSYPEESDGEGGKVTLRKKTIWPRYNNEVETLKFQLGMVFISREQMNKEHHHLAFIKG